MENYTIKDGRRYLHVTAALNIIRMPFLEIWRGNNGNEVCNQILNEARKKGIEFHEYAHLMDVDKGDEINLEELLEEMKKWVFYYREWFFENVEKSILTEELLFSDKYMYCGRPDAVLVLKGRKVPDLFDRKTGKHLHKKDEYQLAAYKKLLKENGIITNNRTILHCRKKLVLPGTGEKLLNREDHGKDFRMFLYAAELYRDINGGK